ncbi:ribbon-helix-helix protein, CopG family [Methanonatronarchaeum sp. AMET-Sl]|uniref:ribbon-helix-helix protein, CopG family n=1 Tax=Methanonatronarchaeum sp. AMET-Sl TaxID=3037654 RepID=UPI00244DC617|nr:ribbon-helix-helix protein, CopG family [Methanonatronarchaeum sp. AMET-Sl]WGI17532.1 ribbon-helix-helix protein, CopG family [Methanonatronarchaeum sp. AMET-Sl]
MTNRVTIVLDEESQHLLDQLKEEFDQNQSEVVRNALKFYSENKEFLENYGEDRVKFYADMLFKGEHVILDMDHWILFLKYLKDIPDDSELWQEIEKVAESHAEQLKETIDGPKEYLERIEACNFFKLNQTSPKEYTLILNNNESKKFIKQLVENTLRGMGYEVEVIEGVSKIRVKVTSNPT